MKQSLINIIRHNYLNCSACIVWVYYTVVPVLFVYHTVVPVLWVYHIWLTHTGEDVFILSNVCHFSPLKVVNENSFAILDRRLRGNCSVEVGVPLFVTE